MSYALVYTDVAREDIEKLKKSGDMVAIRKLAIMLEELIDHPFTAVSYTHLTLPTNREV